MSSPRLVFRRRSVTGVTYGPWRETYHDTSSGGTQTATRVFVLDLSEGGQLCIFPNLLTNEQQVKIRSELLQCGWFRQYKVQNQDEPRTHFLLHADATEPAAAAAANHKDGGGQYLEDPELPQPGYRYNTVRLKARPLHRLPQVQALATDLQRLACRQFPHLLVPAENTTDTRTTTFWNIGVNPVLYRDGRDHMGFHADDDQGESLIFSVVVASPNGTARKVRIQSKNKREEIELYLDASDGYSMDGTMQEHYTHSVPSDSRCKASQLADSSIDHQRNTRIAVVFRRGRQVMQNKDSGRPCASLTPRPEVSYHFGRMDHSVLEEGATYSRQQLFELNAHRSQQRGVSGNREVGCNAIIVSGGRKDGLGYDGLFHLVYAAQFCEGAWSLLASATANKPIRVFRSSSFVTSVFRATRPGKQTVYRYDGLYRVEAVFYKSGSDISDKNDGDFIYRVENVANHVAAIKQNAPNRIYFFCLERLSNDASCETFSNRLSNTDLLEVAIQAKTLSELACVAIQGLPPQPQQPQSRNQPLHQCKLKDWQDYVLFKNWKPERDCDISTMPENFRFPAAKNTQHRKQVRHTNWNAHPRLSPVDAIAAQQLHMLRAELGGASILRNLAENGSIMPVYQTTNSSEACSRHTATDSLIEALYCCRNHCDAEEVSNRLSRSGVRKGMKYLETMERTRAGCAKVPSAATKHHCKLKHRPTLWYHCHRENKHVGVSVTKAFCNEGSLVKSRPKRRQSRRIHSNSLALESVALKRKLKEEATDSAKSLCRMEAGSLLEEKLSAVLQKPRHTELAGAEQQQQQQRRRRQRKMVVPLSSATQGLKLSISPRRISVRRSPRNHPSSLRNDAIKPDALQNVLAKRTRQKGKRPLTKCAPMRKTRR